MYLLALPPQRWAYRALQDPSALNEAGMPRWVMDSMRYVVKSLPLGGVITLPDFEGLCVPDVGDFLKKVMGFMARHTQSLIDNSPKLYHTASRQTGTKWKRWFDTEKSALQALSESCKHSSKSLFE
jgi:hypothetical protein